MGYNFQTSLAAYHSLFPELNEKQKQIYVCLCEFGPLTNQEISEKIHRPINCITPRTGELVEMGLAAPDGLKKGPSGRLATIWRPVLGERRPEHQPELF